MDRTGENAFDLNDGHYGNKSYNNGKEQDSV